MAKGKKRGRGRGAGAADSAPTETSGQETARAPVPSADSAASQQVPPSQPHDAPSPRGGTAGAGSSGHGRGRGARTATVSSVAGAAPVGPGSGPGAPSTPPSGPLRMSSTVPPGLPPYGPSGAPPVAPAAAAAPKKHGTAVDAPNKHGGTAVDAEAEAIAAKFSEMRFKGKSTAEMKQILAYGKQHPVMDRPGVGVDGVKVQLVTNMFEVNFKPFAVEKYDVAIFAVRTNKRGEDELREIRNKTSCWEIFWAIARRDGLSAGEQDAARIFGNVKTATCRCVYDKAKFMYACPALQLPQKKVHIRVEGRLTESDRARREGAAPRYEMRLQWINTVSINDFQAQYQREPTAGLREVLQVLDAYFKQMHYFNDTLTSAGRMFYMPNEVLYNEWGMELIRGFYSSPCIVGNGWKLVLNVEMVASTFYKMPMPQERTPGIQFVANLLKCNVNQMPRRLDQRQWAALNKEIKGLHFKSTHLGHRFRCAGLSLPNVTASSHRFAHDGRQMSTVEYFRSQYQINLQYVDLPMLKKDGERFFPIEMCVLATRQKVPIKRIAGSFQEQIVKRTAIPPIDRQEQIQRLAQMSVNNNNDPTLQQVNISVALRLLRVPGRVLHPPKIQYEGKGPKSVVDGGPGKWNMSGKRLLKPANNEVANCRVGVLIVAQSRFHNREMDNFEEFYQMLRQHANAMGLNLPQIEHDHYFACEEFQLDSGIERARNGLNSARKFLFVIMPRKDPVLYGKTKFLCDSNESAPIVSQVLQSANVFKTKSRRDYSTLSNICLKINAKLGGVNSELKDSQFAKSEIVQRLLARPSGPAILFGMDVTHDTGGQSPSIAAMAVSLDAMAQRYTSLERILPPKTEIPSVELIKECVKTGLTRFYKTNRLKPVHIIYFRDGVSDGQFTEVMFKELCGIQEACRELDKTGAYRPEVTFIVVQKRHKTRLFPEKMDRGDKPMRQNVKAGTTVDTDITHPVMFDFYLCSHEGIQGTSKPTHYYVLHDDHNFKPDELQQLAYSLCFTYARCTRAVSLPAPVYYAHQIAAHAKYRLQGSGLDPSMSDTVSMASGGSGASLLTEQRIADIQRRICVRSDGPGTVNGMFWQ